MLKILHARLQQYVNCEIPDIQAGFRKGKGNINFCFINYAKAFDGVDHKKLWKILKEMGIPEPPDLPLEKPVCRSGSNS